MTSALDMDVDSVQLAVQVIRAVLDARLPAALDQRQAIEDALLVHGEVCMRVAIGHVECEARCSRSAPVELWSVRVEEEEGAREGGGPLLPAIFLLNAVRSYVHFSQLSAWLRPATSDGPPPPAAATYDLLQQSELFPAPEDATVGEHSFPLAFGSASSIKQQQPRRVVRVVVRYVLRAQPLTPSGVCVQLGRMPTDEWLLPSPLPSPPPHDDDKRGPALASSPVFDVATQQLIRRVKHKASEPLQWSLNGPAMKQLHFEELLIENIRNQRKENSIEDRRKKKSIEEWKKRKERKMEEEKEEKTQRINDELPRSERVKVRRMVGGWEECVLRGSMDEKPLPDAGYTLQIVPTGTPPVRLRLRVATLTDTVATCVGRTTVTEATRVCESASTGKMIRRRGYELATSGRLQMVLLNGEGGAMQALSVPYDVHGMQPRTNTIIRHRVRFERKNWRECGGGGQAPLRYLVQMSISCDRMGRVFLTGGLTVVFSTDMSIDGENVRVSGGRAVHQASLPFELRSETTIAPFYMRNQKAKL